MSELREQHIASSDQDEEIMTPKGIRAGGKKRGVVSPMPIQALRKKCRRKGGGSNISAEDAVDAAYPEPEDPCGGEEEPTEEMNEEPQEGELEVSEAPEELGEDTGSWDEPAEQSARLWATQGESPRRETNGSAHFVSSDAWVTKDGAGLVGDRDRARETGELKRKETGLVAPLSTVQGGHPAHGREYFRNPAVTPPFILDVSGLSNMSSYTKLKDVMSMAAFESVEARNTRLITPALKSYLTLWFLIHLPELGTDLRKDGDAWQRWSNAVFLDRLYQGLHKAVGPAVTGGKSARIASMINLSLVLNPSSDTGLNEYLSALVKEGDCADWSAEDKITLYTGLLDAIDREKESDEGMARVIRRGMEAHWETIKADREALESYSLTEWGLQLAERFEGPYQAYRLMVNEMNWVVEKKPRQHKPAAGSDGRHAMSRDCNHANQSRGRQEPYGGGSRSPVGMMGVKGNLHPGGKGAPSAAGKYVPNGSRVFCDGCGAIGHTRQSCTMTSHPNFNKDVRTFFKDTPVGKNLASEPRGLKCLSWDKRWDGKDWKPYRREEGGTSSGTFHGGKDGYPHLGVVQATGGEGDSTFCWVAPPGSLTTEGNGTLNIKTLLDTGSLHGNFCSAQVADGLRQGSAVVNGKGQLVNKACRDRVRVTLATSGMEVITSGSVRFRLGVTDEISKQVVWFDNLTAHVLPDLAFPLILGLPTIRHLRLVRLMPSFFLGKEDVHQLSCHGQSSQCNRPASSPHREGGGEVDTHKQGDTGQRAERYPSCTTPVIELGAGELHRAVARQVQLLHMQVLRHGVEDEYVGDQEDDLFFDPSFVQKESGQERARMGLINKIKIVGPPSLQAQIRELCRAYADIFSETVREEPADLPPLELDVDLSKWMDRKNQGPPRLQTRDKDTDLRSQVIALQDFKVLEPSTAGHYSQVHLVKKPDGKWRFCIDFVRLNEATRSMEHWPIQNISLMLRRIGHGSPRYFGKMDLTSGYHQAPMHENSRVFTAFITLMGVFQWLRVPMGLKGAPSYFQRVMATVVLAGLLYVCCEVYLDDVLVYGNTEEEFIENLEAVFDRFRTRKLTLNPKKCEFGMEEVEFVGHVIGKDGTITFSQEKKGKVLDFPLPEKMKQLKGFLGLVNYFRDNVRDISNLVKPLHNMVKDYKRGTKLVWTEELIARYREVQDRVANCPAIYFVDDNAPIFVQTDASDYGIGGYIFQVKDGRQYPIVFISKALAKSQLHWSTIEKEAFAIYYVLKKYDYLLRDVKFVLQTDHRNLTYINTESSAKVKRWKLELQEYDFSLEYIPGKDNVAADGFSRLCDNLGEEAIQGDIEEGMEESDDLIVTGGKRRKLCSMLVNGEVDETEIPQDKITLLEQVHNSTVGHFGQERTVNRLIAGGHRWRYMRRHVKTFIKQCPVCQLRDPLHKQIKLHKFTTASYMPMDTLNMDTIGPLEADIDGNKYILVIIDCFTRFVELYATKDTSALACARSLLNHVGRYGTPRYIRSDRGTQFVNDIIQDFMKLIGTEHNLTTAYSKEENAIVERANKEVMRHLTAILYDKRIREVWSMDYLPLVQRIINAQEHDTIGVSPAELLFGNAIDLYRGILTPFISEEEREKSSDQLSDYYIKMLEAQAKLIEVAQDQQLIHDSYHISQMEDGIEGFPVNSYVLYSPPEGQRDKLQMKKAGPYRVVNRIGDIYSIQDLINHKSIDTHASALTPFAYDPNRTDPTSVAMHNAGEFAIDFIVRHEGTPTRRKAMRFLVRWKGLTAEEETWEPYKEVRTTQAFVDYCKDNRLKSLVSARYKDW